MDYKYESKGFGKTRKMTKRERFGFVQQILIEHEQGTSLNRLADKYGIRRDTAKYMIQKARRYKDDPDSYLKSMSKQEIANIYHIHKSTLWRQFQKYVKNISLLP